MFKNLLIMKENNHIYNNGYYVKNSEKILINSNSIIENTKTYKNVEITEKINRKNKFFVNNSIIQTDTISCVIKMRQSGITGNISVLNFANAMVAGGGYIVGGNAQEESLCRASLLFHSIKTQKEMYYINRKKITPLYSDIMIYSKDISVFRDYNNSFLDEPIQCSFITSPAINKKIARFFYPNQKINNLMQDRINKIISLAVYQNSEVIILGAFGCGAFGNKKEDIFLNFENAINKYVSEKTRIIFACI